MKTIPFQQPQEWQFIEELKSPQRWFVNWKKPDRQHEPIIKEEFPDPEGVLDTAYHTLRIFMKEMLPSVFAVTTCWEATECFESFCLHIDANQAVISAADTEGIRRGIYLLIDEWLASQTPELSPKTVEKRPWLKTRISRCFFGPIKRPPLYRDELLDVCDYYPDNYLDRLASEGVNGLWLSVSFKDLCRTRFTPDAAPDREIRFAKLQRTIDKCRRYGIKIYLFCNEPESWEFESDILKNHPSLGGPSLAGKKCFCPFSPEGREYLHDSMFQIFSGVNNLGGMINISLGEGITTCLSSVGSHDNSSIRCPSVCGASYREIMCTALESMSWGMHDATPEAEFISWFYMPSPQDVPEWIYDIVEHAPKDVITQLNFESGAKVEQLGKIRCGGDYWLSISAPSENYVRFVRAAKKENVSVSAKIQVGCSHEVATVPFVPVPSLLYRKYEAMHRLGVRHVMQCWYFGNYPGLMNRAAGKLAFFDFNKSENEFLIELAKTQWGEYAPMVVEGWGHLSVAYENYPVSNMFQYFGPVADGVTWPLHLYHADRRLLPTWLLNRDFSGDNICECLENHTLDEAVTLMERVVSSWKRGTEIFDGLRGKFLGNAECLLDIGLINALGIQFSSALHILMFYQLRRRLFQKPDTDILAEMRNIVEMEISGRKKMLLLIMKDSRLGFHSEAEGYKYNHEKIAESTAMLENLLANDFPRAEREIQIGQFFNGISRESYKIGVSGKIDCASFSWSAVIKEKSIIFEIECKRRYRILDEIYLGIDNKGSDFPCLFHGCSTGKKYVVPDGAECRISSHSDGWNISLQIPEKSLPGSSFHDLRLNIVRLADDYQTRYSWPHSNVLNEARMNLIFYDPSNMGDLNGDSIRSPIGRLAFPG